MSEPGLQERVARLEGRTEDFGERGDPLESRIDAFERRVDARVAATDRRFEQVTVRGQALEGTVAKQFRWLAGGDARRGAPEPRDTTWLPDLRGVHVPLLWRSEFRNIFATRLRNSRLTPEAAVSPGPDTLA